MSFSDRITHPASSTAAIAIAVIGAATLVGAWIFEYGFDIRPCPLCLQQRYGYYFTIPFAALLAFFAARGLARPPILAGFALIITAMAANGVLGVYHSGIEWGLWTGTAECSGGIGDLGGGNLLDEIRNTTVKVVRCDEVQWRFLGLSLAGYNALISALMALIAFAAMRPSRP
jgi:disulfide bond formation protein DsbB